MKILTLLILVVKFHACICDTLTTDTNITSAENINGQLLINLGRQMNKPVLTLFGMAIKNLHRCDEWTEWTECKAKQLGSFGIRARTRTCNADLSIDHDENTVETDWSLCEGSLQQPIRKKITKKTCPSHFNFTTNGFCIKLYMNKTTNIDAERQCQQDGGYLINIDSDAKYNDVKGILNTGPSNVHVGGRRKATSSEWEFFYGENNGFYSRYWFSSNYPTSDTSKHCLALSITRWYDMSCADQYPFLCEIAY